jgi:hypothetical protein
MSKWCAPNREGSRLTCYTKENLIEIAKSYNRKMKRNEKKILIKNRNKTQLWNDIRRSLNNKCKDEICWSEQSFVKNKRILKESFRSKRPEIWREENYETWLNEDDILNVMKQYEKKYKNFLFIGPIPLDCGINNELYCQLTNFNINKLFKNGITKIGMIINTDYSNGTGIHWYSLMIDIEKRKITHFCSYGEEPLKETKKIMKKIKEDLKKMNIDMILEYNNKRHQYDGFSCGMYSMFFIIKSLEGKSLKQINRMKLDTNKMQKLKMLWYRD